MRHLLAALSLFALAGVASAQDRIPADEAQRIARLLIETSDKANDLPLKVEADADKPVGIRHGDIGTMIIPDKRLTAEMIDKAGPEVTPVAYHWFRKIAPARDGKVTANAKLRILTVNANGEDLMLPLCTLGVRKGSAGPELVVLGKDKEPLVTVPLKKVETQQELPIEIEGRKEDDTGVLTINLFGKYRAELKVMEQES
jgi:hypothetical protein